MNTTQANLDIKLNEPEVVETKAIVVASTPDSALELIHAAVEKGLSAETVEKLYALHERISDRFEARSFNVAMTQFQLACPVIPKTGKDRNITVAGTNQPRLYAQLEQDILPVVGPVLLRHGFSWTWDTDAVTYPDRIHVTCKLRHVDGHESTASFAAPPDDRENRRLSPAQKLGAVETYCQRLAFIQVTGILPGDRDTDAAPGEKITESQVLDLQSTMEEVKMNKARFLKLMGVERLEDITGATYEIALNALSSKRAAQ